MKFRGDTGSGRLRGLPQRIATCQAAIASALVVIACQPVEKAEEKLFTQCKLEVKEGSHPSSKQYFFDSERQCLGVSWLVPNSVSFRLSPPGASTLQRATILADIRSVRGGRGAPARSSRRVEVESYFAPPGGLEQSKRNALRSIQAGEKGLEWRGLFVSRGRQFSNGMIPVVVWKDEDDFAICTVLLESEMEKVSEICTVHSGLASGIVLKYPAQASDIFLGSVRDMDVVSRVEALIVRDG